MKTILMGILLLTSISSNSARSTQLIDLLDGNDYGSIARNGNFCGMHFEKNNRGDMVVEFIANPLNNNRCNDAGLVFIASCGEDQCNMAINEYYNGRPIIYRMIVLPDGNFLKYSNFYNGESYDENRPIKYRRVRN